MEFQRFQLVSLEDRGEKAKASRIERERERGRGREREDKEGTNVASLLSPVLPSFGNRSFLPPLSMSAREGREGKKGEGGCGSK